MTPGATTERANRIESVSRATAVAVIAGVLVVSMVIIRPAMPDKIILLTGPEGSTYYELGTRYASILRDRGLETDVVATGGGLDNLQRLAVGDHNAVAFAPSNIENAHGVTVDSSHLRALGSVGFEPLWLFYRSDLEIQDVGDLAGLRVATGGPGTVTDVVARALFDLNGISEAVTVVFSEGQAPDSEADALLRGTTDAVFALGDPRSPAVRRMLTSRGVAFLSFERAAAYAANVSGITTLTAPEGVFDLTRNNPPEDASLLAAATTLVASEGLNPAVVRMVLSAASQVPETRSAFSTEIRFPNKDFVTLPLKPAAKKYFDKGEAGLSSRLPYRVARTLNHLGFVVLPLLALTIVLIKVVPISLSIWMKVKLTGFLKRLLVVEKTDAAGGDRSKLLAELDAIDRASAKLYVPRSKIPDYLDFRQFLHDMRDRVSSRNTPQT